MVDQKTCRGCGKKLGASRSREHILPQWLHPYVEIPGVRLEHRAVNEQGSRFLRRHDLNNFTLKSICRNCNNGWLSRLETDVRPIIIPLIEGARSAGSLSVKERTTIARWAFKTAFMILAVQETVPVPWPLFERWAQTGAHDLDPALIFALSDIPSTPGFGYVTESDDLDDSPVHPVNARVSICIRSLLLVILIPLDDRGRVPGKGNHLYQLLWPRDREPIYVPTDVAPIVERPYAAFIKYLAGFAHAGVPRSKQVRD